MQWMTAGRGVLHEENAPAGTIAHTLQIWVNLPATAKITEPRYQDLVGDEVPVKRELGVGARVFSGRSGDVLSTTLNHVPITMVDAQLVPGATFTHALPGTDNGFLVVLHGLVAVGERRATVDTGELAWLTRTDDANPSTVVIDADAEPVRILILSGQPVNEPVVFGGPFDMNSQSEIRQAFEEYHARRI